MADLVPIRGTLVVTGASSGIGEALAKLAAPHGWHLVLAARREDRLRALAAECLALGAAGVVPVPIDLAAPGQAPRLAAALEGLPAPVALVNNAGVFVFKPLVEMTDEEIDRELAVNLGGLIRATRAVLPRLLADGVGDLVNVLSVSATTDFAAASVYGATKAGGRQFARDLALEVRPKGIRVGSVFPGATATPIWEGQSWHPDEARMMPASAVAEAILAMVEAPRDRCFDEVVIIPPAGNA